VRVGECSQESRERDRGVVLVVPLVPATGGNGLAMRAGMLLEALAGHCGVDLIIVPVSGAAEDTAWAAGLARSLTLVAPVSGDAARSHLTRQLADPALRDRLARSAPLPARAILAPPTLALDALAEPGALTRPGMHARRPLAVVAMRGYLAPFGITLARTLEAGRTVIDLDDDDEILARSYGETAEADAVGRLARAWLPDADVVCAASSQEAEAMAPRYGIPHVRTLPNAVRLPAPLAPPPAKHRLLFVGNLTYAPNLEAAQALITEVLPRVQAKYPDATLDLVGPHAGDLAGASAATRVTGRVADLRTWYDSADVVVAPLWHGGGTRIKVLEAFAYGRPVVATPLAVRGIDVRGDRDVLLADSPQALADAVSALFETPALGARLCEHAGRVVRERYAQSVVAGLVWDLVTDGPAEQNGSVPRMERV
jgi:glycosyltransferase involved in cell wall biosynthesis